ncbi:MULTISPECIES: antitoxin Xre/MbcA/ParS toxin-binding domain-containing protein [unclassified Pseudomonas]|uniref:antitoxin Xre/MbcA/ParS toxin-binding domain-containing protein n=1 Tax=unclassified Pseudomonas TaxID=196821 RepID=UPI00382BF86A
MSDARTIAPCTCSPIACWSAEHRCFVGRYEQILSVAGGVFGDRDKAQRWLGRPVVGLGHRTPCTLLYTPTGYSDVLDLLMRIEHGICF